MFNYGCDMSTVTFGVFSMPQAIYQNMFIVTNRTTVKAPSANDISRLDMSGERTEWTKS